MLATDLCDMIACCHMRNVSDVSRSTISMTVNKGAMLTTLNSSGERLHTSGSSGEQGDSLREKGSIRLTAGTMGSKGSDVSVESSASSAADGTPASRKAGVWTDFFCVWVVHIIMPWAVVLILLFGAFWADVFAMQVTSTKNVGICWRSFVGCIIEFLQSFSNHSTVLSTTTAKSVEEGANKFTVTKVYNSTMKNRGVLLTLSDFFRERKRRTNPRAVTWQCEHSKKRLELSRKSCPSATTCGRTFLARIRLLKLCFYMFDPRKEWDVPILCSRLRYICI